VNLLICTVGSGKGGNEESREGAEANEIVINEQEDISARHKQVAVVLIKERKALVKKLVEMDQIHQSLEQSLKDSASRSADSQQSAQAEAVLEKQRIEFDMEREQYKARLAREESRNNQLTADIERLSLHIEQLQLQMGMKRLTDNGPSLVVDSMLSPAACGHPMSVPGMRVVTPGSTSAVPASSKNSVSPHTPPEMRRMISDPHGMDHGGLGHSYVLSPSSRLSANQEYLLRQAGSDIAAAPWLDPRPAVPAKPVSVDPLAAKLLTVVPPPSGTVYHHSNSSSHTANFITQPPSVVRAGTAPSNNIGLVVSMEPSPNQVRRSASVTRGNPPPVPPNKPNIQVVTTASQRLPPGEKPQPPPRFVGISPSKDNRSPKPTDGTDGPQVLVK
jgi:Skp family chaperone for outer membrane proteins